MSVEKITRRASGQQAQYFAGTRKGMDSKMIRRIFAVALLVSLAAPAADPRPAAAAEMPEMNLTDFNDVAAKHPAGDALKRLFPGKDAAPTALPAPADWKPTGLSKKDYLK